MYNTRKKFAMKSILSPVNFYSYFSSLIRALCKSFTSVVYISVNNIYRLALNFYLDVKDLLTSKIERLERVISKLEEKELKG